MQVDDIGVFITDVGKSGHWATALTAAGKRLHDKPLPNDQSKLRDLYHRLSSHGSLLVVVDQPATIGALAVAVAQDMGHHRGLPAGPVDEAHRRPDPRTGQDRPT